MHFKVKLLLNIEKVIHFGTDKKESEWYKLGHREYHSGCF